MSKEEFIAQKLGIDIRKGAAKPARKATRSLSILPYYKGEDPKFANNMLRLYPFEHIAPRFFKRYWAHHYFLLFRP